MSNEDNNAPIANFRIGLVKGSVWAIEANGKKFYSTKICIAYKSDDQWKDGMNYNHDDLLNLSKVAERCEAFIAKLSN